MIVQLVASYFLKQQKDKLWVMISALQVIVYMPIYQADVPATLEIFLEALRRIAEFKVIEPQMILEWVGMEDILKDNSLSEEAKIKQQNY